MDGWIPGGYEKGTIRSLCRNWLMFHLILVAGEGIEPPTRGFSIP